jgi:hypothetical protein
VFDDKSARALVPEFKREAVRLLETSEKSFADLARELGLLRMSETAMRKKPGAKSKDGDFFLHAFCGEQRRTIT